MKGRAALLRRLHAGPDLLVLPNAWDAVSARHFASKGFPAVATTSGGVARAIGHDDGEAAPPGEMFAAVARIVAAVDVPVTADLESGYGLEPAELVDRLLDTGAVGLNLEDTDHRGPGPLVDLEQQADRLAAVKEAGQAAGVDLVLNARVDVHLRQVGPAEERMGHALRRAVRYRAAGADCIFPIGVDDEATIAGFVDGVDAPVNVLVRAGSPSLARLHEMGVARVTFGSGLQRVALSAASAHLDQLGAGRTMHANGP